jgi:hypothetical protein
VPAERDKREAPVSVHRPAPGVLGTPSRAAVVEKAAGYQDADIIAVGSQLPRCPRTSSVAGAVDGRRLKGSKGRRVDAQGTTGRPEAPPSAVRLATRGIVVR